MVVAGFGWFWLVVGRCRCFWLVPRFSMYENLICLYWSKNTSK